MRAKLIKRPKPPAPQLGGIVERPPGELTPWPNNPRTHSEKQLTKLSASMQEFGFTAPVLVDAAGVILSGHGRVEAAARIGLPTVPTRVLSGLTATRKRAYVIADHKLAELSAWDGDLLKGELEFLIQADFAVEVTGFSTAEIDIMLDDPAQAVTSDPDDLQPEDITPKVVSRPGDLWRLGKHLILCGNALEPEVYERVMQGALAQMAAERGRWDYETLKSKTLEWVDRLYRRDQPVYIMVERAGSGISLAQFLEKARADERYRCFRRRPNEDKLTRAARVLPWFEAGILISNIPGRNAWVEPYLNKFMNFPNGANDDQVDSLVQLFHLNLVRSFLSAPTTESHLCDLDK
jgi:predicted phage terminase large subunit-like protein